MSDAKPLSMRGPASVDIKVSFGCWLFLLSDIIVFAGLFAAYAVLVNRTAGGPDGKDLFDKTHVFIETACLLVSSFTCGMMSLASEERRRGETYLWALSTIVLGAGFVGLEVSEFLGMIDKGTGPDRSAFLSAFFALVGMHGAHVTSGLIWLVSMMGQVAVFGFKPTVMRRLRCFSLFWHALDIVWVGIFTIVYLGAR
jgi:cytochrome o ubiquinol oxidase subunit 3